MSRRVSLPAADDLFRPTGDEADPAAGNPQGSARPEASRDEASRSVRAVPDQPQVDDSERDEPARRAASGRVRHDEKVTVYVTADELIGIERARLTLRGEHGLAVDRGRLVREALALVLRDLDERAEESMLVTRLRAE